jgi:putative endonuclease
VTAVPPSRGSNRRRTRPPGSATLRRADRWFVYIARCADGTLYVGIARDVAARIAAHDAGRGARYTRGRGPLRVLATRRCASHGDALRLELALKRLPREEKMAAVRTPRKLAAIARRVAEAARARSGGRVLLSDDADRTRGARAGRRRGR